MVFVALGTETVVAAFSAGCGPQVGAASYVSRGPARTRVASARPAMVPPAVASAGGRTAAFICRRLLPTSAMPVDAVQDVVSLRLSCMQPACLGYRLTACELYQNVRPRRFLLLGDGVPGVRQVPQEVHRLERRRSEPAGCWTSEPLPSCADVEVCCQTVTCSRLFATSCHYS